MIRTLALVLLVVALLLVGFLVVLLDGAPARGAICVTIAQDREKVIATGKLEYLGVYRLPHVEEPVVFYRAGPLTIVSPVIDGCVQDGATPVGRFKAEVGV